MATFWRIILLGDDDHVLHYVDGSVIVCLVGVIALLSRRWPVSRARLKALLPGLELAALERFSFLAYPLSGGFQEWSLLPQALAGPLLSTEWKMRKFLGPLAAFRLLAVYRRAA